MPNVMTLFGPAFLFLCNENCNSYQYYSVSKLLLPNGRPRPMRLRGKGPGRLSTD